VLEKAAIECRGEWPFDVGQEQPAIIKVGATTPMTKKTWAERHQIAETELRSVLRVPDPNRTRGKKILVYDDVYTDGHTLNEVARCLRQDGYAAAVCGVTLARQPYRGRS
jgi:predicted amidophosphoribosyltransferase